MYSVLGVFSYLTTLIIVLSSDHKVIARVRTRGGVFLVRQFDAPRGTGLQHPVNFLGPPIPTTQVWQMVWW